MKILAYIGGIFRKDVGDANFNALVRAYPAGQKGDAGHFFKSRLPLNDRRTNQILKLLDSMGMRKRQDQSAGKELVRFSYNLHRIYTAKELADCEFLEFRPVDGAYHDAERNADGSLFVAEGRVASEGWKDRDFISAYGRETCVFAPARTKDILDVEELLRLVWRPVDYWPSGSELEPREKLLRRIGRPFWELDGEIDLPPVSDTVELRDEEKTVVLPGSRRTGVYLFDGDYARPEMHYKVSHFDEVGPFDIARTYENFGTVAGSEYRRDLSKIVVSARFFTACQRLGLQADWLPVRIDPD